MAKTKPSPETEAKSSSAAKEAKKQPSPETESRLYDVAEILEHEGTANTTQYLRNFVDYGHEDNCWIHKDDMDGCESLIEQYWASKRVQSIGHR